MLCDPNANLNYPNLRNGNQGGGECSRSKSSITFKRDLALQNKPLSKQPFKTQPQIKNEDAT